MIHILKIHYIGIKTRSNFHSNWPYDRTISKCIAQLPTDPDISSRLSKFKGHFPEVLTNLLSSSFVFSIARKRQTSLLNIRRLERVEGQSRLETKMTRVSTRGNIGRARWTLLVRTIARKSKNSSCVTLVRQKPREIRLSHLLLSLSLVDRSNASSFFCRMTRNCAAFFFWWPKMAEDVLQPC